MPYLKSREVQYRPTVRTCRANESSPPSAALFPSFHPFPFFFLVFVFLPSGLLGQSRLSVPPSLIRTAAFLLPLRLPLIPRELRRGLRVSEIQLHTVYTARHCLCISSHTLCPLEELGIASVAAPFGRTGSRALEP